MLQARRSSSDNGRFSIADLYFQGFFALAMARRSILGKMPAQCVSFSSRGPLWFIKGGRVRLATGPVGGVDEFGKRMEQIGNKRKRASEDRLRWIVRLQRRGLPRVVSTLWWLWISGQILRGWESALIGGASLVLNKGLALWEHRSSSCTFRAAISSDRPAKRRSRTSWNVMEADTSSPRQLSPSIHHWLSEQLSERYLVLARVACE